MFVSVCGCFHSVIFVISSNRLHVFLFGPAIEMAATGGRLLCYMEPILMCVRVGYRLGAVFNTMLNFIFILLWSVQGILVEYDKRHIYELPGQWWRILLFVSPPNPPTLTVAHTLSSLIQILIVWAVKSLNMTCSN